MTAPMNAAGTTGGDWRWPLWGVAAGLLGATGHLFSIQNPSEEEYRGGADVIDAIERGPYHVGIVSGLAGVFCLLIFAAGRRGCGAGRARLRRSAWRPAPSTWRLRRAPAR